MLKIDYVIGKLVLTPMTGDKEVCLWRKGGQKQLSFETDLENKLLEFHLRGGRVSLTFEETQGLAQFSARFDCLVGGECRTHQGWLLAAPQRTEECSICFKALHVGQSYLHLPCGHGPCFHDHCLRHWLRTCPPDDKGGRRRTCPLCRKQVPVRLSLIKPAGREGPPVAAAAAVVPGSTVCRTGATAGQQAAATGAAVLLPRIPSAMR